MAIRLKGSIIIFSVLFTHGAWAQQISLRGTVLGPNQRPILGASINVKNSKIGNSTDSAGQFQIRVSVFDSIKITAIGFADTIIAVDLEKHLVIELRPQALSLKPVIVSESIRAASPTGSDRVTREALIASSFQDYLRISDFSSGTIVNSYFSPNLNKYVRTQSFGMGAMNRFNTGTMLPVIVHKEETKGSRYLLEKFVHGIIVDQNNTVMLDAGYLLNYDKIAGQLIMTQDAKSYMEVDKDKVLGFAFKAKDSSYIFLNVPILSKVNYFLLLANGPKYSAYKSIKTRFVKSTYTSNGLVETGNNYDEYVDYQVYYWVDEINKTAGIFELKKKSVKTLFPAEKEKIDAFLSKHKMEDIDDDFVTRLIRYLNQ